MNADLIARREQQVLYDKKWIRFLRRAWLFRYVPFVRGVLAAGSLATGNVHEHSDFDVIILVRRHRIFTARFLSVLATEFLGVRNRKLTRGRRANDKICLNHFITDTNYRLSPPHNAYWIALYRRLVPVYGSRETIQKFFDANADWMGGRRMYAEDMRHLFKSSSGLETIMERFLSGRFGDVLERLLRAVQLFRYRASALHDPPGVKPRLIFHDDELELHPDTSRIEAMLRSGESFDTH